MVECLAPQSPPREDILRKRAGVGQHGEDMMGGGRSSSSPSNNIIMSFTGVIYPSVIRNTFHTSQFAKHLQVHSIQSSSIRSASGETPGSILKQVRFPLWRPVSLVHPSQEAECSRARSQHLLHGHEWCVTYISYLVLNTSLLSHALLSFATWLFYLHLSSPGMWAMNFLIGFN